MNIERVNIARNRSSEMNYQQLNQEETERTRDEYLDEQEKLNQQKDHLSKTNLYRFRIIDTEINASLTLQIFMYYNLFYSCLCFLILITSIGYKVIFN
jgi:hypothetical protein